MSEDSILKLAKEIEAKKKGSKKSKGANTKTRAEVDTKLILEELVDTRIELFEKQEKRKDTKDS